MRNKVEIAGGREYFIGLDSNQSEYSVQEDATTIDASNYNGGFGQITFSAVRTNDSKFALNKVMRLEDAVQGKVTGTIRDVATSDRNVTFTADSIIGLFNSHQEVPPYSGTLMGLIQYYMDIVEIPNGLEIPGTTLIDGYEEPLGNRPVAVLGFSGNMWDQIKRILVAQRLEMALVFDKIVVRNLRVNTATMDRATTLGEQVNAQTLAKLIEINYYNLREMPGFSQEFYPVPSQGEPNIYQVNAGEVREFSVPLDGSMYLVNEPVMLDFVENRSYEGTNGVYSIVGNDDIPIQPAQWNAMGGWLQTALSPDGSTLTIRIKGMTDTNLQPYRVAMSSGGGNYYNSLHITGEGITSDVKTLTLHTGAPPHSTGEDVGITIDNPNISTLAEAYTAGAVAAGTYAGPNYTLSGTVTSLNRYDADQSLATATMLDFNQWWSDTGHPSSMAQFNIEWSPDLMADWNEYWEQFIANSFVNQAFGQASGARIIGDDSNFRITSTTITPAGVQFTATEDTLIQDFNLVWSGATMEDFNNQQVAATQGEFALAPLRRVA